MSISRNSKALQPYLLDAPQTLVFLFGLVLPIAVILIVSFWNFNGIATTPGFTLKHYAGIFTSPAYLSTYATYTKLFAIR